MPESRFFSSRLAGAGLTEPKFVRTAVATGGDPLTSIVQQASATSAAATIVCPADIQAGDLLVLSDNAFNFSGSPTAVIPAGFTSIVNTVLTGGVGVQRAIISYKIANGSEASATLTGMDADLERKILLVFRGDIAIASASPNVFGAEGTTGDPVQQNVSASGATSPLVILASYASVLNAIDPRTFSPAKDGEVAGDTAFYLAWKIYNSSPSDVTVDMENEGESILQSGYISCT